MKILTKKCKQCGNEYHKKKNVGMPHWTSGKNKYCSRVCQHKALVGQPAWNKGKKLGFVPEHAFKKGHVPWSKGKRGVLASGDKHHKWKGDDVGYAGLHYWVSRWKGRPKKCERCGTTEAKKYEWANIDHEYRRVLDDYVRMCTACHRNYDYALSK